MKYLLAMGLIVFALLFAWIGYQDQPTNNEPPMETLEGRVVGIIDGDSFRIQTREGLRRVELYGIDAPEAGQPFSEMSTYYLANLIDGRNVQVTQVRIDAYGDIVGKVRVDGLSVNRLMLTEGYAWAQRDGVQNRVLAGLESVARGKQLGLWHNENPVSPWEFRSLRENG